MTRRHPNDRSDPRILLAAGGLGGLVGLFLFFVMAVAFVNDPPLDPPAGDASTVNRPGPTSTAPTWPDPATMPKSTVDTLDDYVGFASNAGPLDATPTSTSSAPTPTTADLRPAVTPSSSSSTTARTSPSSPPPASSSTSAPPSAPTTTTSPPPTSTTTAPPASTTTAPPPTTTTEPPPPTTTTTAVVEVTVPSVAASLLTILDPALAPKATA